MKKILWFAALLVSFNTIASDKSVKVYLSYASFNVPSKTPYFETYLSAIGNTIKFVKNSKGKYQGAIDIAINFSINGEIKSAKKYTLESPEINDTALGYPNFVDQQRYSLANGNYIMEISVSDKNTNSKNPFITQLPIKINFPDNLISVSDIQFLESFTKSTNTSVISKNGYDLVPYVSSFFPENSNQLKFYLEFYNSKKILGENEKLIVNYFIESSQTLQQLSSFSAFAKQTSNEVNVLLSELNIEQLPTGNYNLRIEIRDKQNKIQADQKIFFQREKKLTRLNFEDLKSIDVSKTFANEFKNKDSLYNFIRAIRPVSTRAEIQYAENQLKGGNLELMQQYFFNFWKTRNDLQPQVAWNEYYVEILKANKDFSAMVLKSYETDRGRVYLQYGVPSSMERVDKEPSAYPYEIWHYDVLVDKSLITEFPFNKQSNRRFVFYNPDLVTNNYQLLHSDAKGEIYNTRWETLIHKRDLHGVGVDAEKSQDEMGSHADDNFKNPK